MGFSKYITVSKFLLLGLLVASCMAKVEDSDPIESVEVTSHTIDRSGFNSKITLFGICPKSTKTLKISIEESLYDMTPEAYNNPSAWVDSSGIPLGVCSNGSLTIKYPVPTPSKNRVIHFKTKAKMIDGRLSLYADLYDVNYTRPAEQLAGFEVTSGGMFASTGGPTGVTLHGSAGIVYMSKAHPILIPPADAFTGTASMRAGLHGILYDDTL